MKKKWTKKDVADMKEMQDSGLTLEEIGDYYGIGKERTRQLIAIHDHESGLSQIDNQLSQLSEEQLYDQLKKAEPEVAIAQACNALGLNKNVVYFARTKLKRDNIPFPSLDDLRRMTDQRDRSITGKKDKITRSRASKKAWANRAKQQNETFLQETNTLELKVGKVVCNVQCGPNVRVSTVAVGDESLTIKVV